MGMPWVKLYTELLDDAKIGFLSEGAQLLFVKLMLLAGECDAEGYLVNGNDPLTVEQIAWRLRLSPAIIAERLAELAGTEQVIVDDGIYLVVNFQKRQGRSQSEKREQWRRRKQRQRDKENVTGESRGTQAGVTPLEGEESRSEGEGEVTPPPEPAKLLAPYKQNPGALKVYYQLTEKGLSDTWQANVEAIVGTTTEDLQFWRELIVDWQGCGYNWGNINGLLECYARRELPSKRNGQQSTGPPKPGPPTVVSGLNQTPEWMSDAKQDP
jgi:hypothetical protein